jgi:hypothetical protein
MPATSGERELTTATDERILFSNSEIVMLLWLVNKVAQFYPKLATETGTAFLMGRVGLECHMSRPL